MKQIYRKTKWRIFLVLTGLLSLCSCVDDGYDLDNASMAIEWEGALGVPVIAESQVTVKQIVEQFDFNGAQAGLIDDNGRLALEFDTTVTFAVPEINEDFENFDKLFQQELTLFEGFSIPPVTLGEQQITFDYTFSAADFWEQVNGGEYTEKHRINRIQFYNIGLILNVTGSDITLNPGSRVNVSLQLPGENNEVVNFEVTEFGTVTEYKDLLLDLNALNTEDIQATITAEGEVDIEGEPTLSVSLSLDFSRIREFIAYGYFNYILTAGTEKLDTYQAGLYDINGIDWKLTLPAARFDFDASSSFGVPLVIQLNELKVKHRDQTDSIEKPLDRQYEIARSNELNTTVMTNIQLADRDIIGDLITTELEGVAVSYVVATKEIDVANPGDEPEQFISSKGKLDFDIQTIVPAEFAAGDYITYTYPDTLEISGEAIDLGEGSDLSQVEALLRLQVYNGLHVPVHAKAWLCSKGIDGLYHKERPYVTDSIELDLKTEQTLKKDIPLTIDRANEWIASDKAIIMEYRVPPLTAEQAEHGIRMNDVIKARIGLGAKGKVLIDDNN